MQKIISMEKIRIGDTVTFRSMTLAGIRKAKRRVVDKTASTVSVSSYHGWKNFIVLQHEIISVERRG